MQRVCKGIPCAYPLQTICKSFAESFAKALQSKGFATFLDLQKAFSKCFFAKPLHESFVNQFHKRNFAKPLHIRYLCKGFAKFILCKGFAKFSCKGFAQENFAKPLHKCKGFAKFLLCKWFTKLLCKGFAKKHFAKAF